MARKPIIDAVAVEDKHASASFAGLYPWQHEAWAQLRTRYPDIAHGILLGGREGTGKRRFADHLTAWLLCLDKSGDIACGNCTSCQWLKTGNHPSLIRIEREVDDKGKQSKQIKIDQIRAITSFVQQTSSGWRIVVIDPAETLNNAAANALLKTLEEPATNVLLILIADSPLHLPATVRSRLQQVSASRMTVPIAVNYIAENANVNAVQAQQLLALAGQSPLLAIALEETPQYQARQAWLSDWCRLRSGQASPLTLSATWQKRLSLPEWLALQQQMIQDVMAIHLNMPVIQQDLDFTAIQRVTNPAMLHHMTQQIIHVTTMQGQNIQPSMVFDHLMGVMAVG